MKISEINTVCFIGAGTMGCVNAVTAGLAGYKVVLYDVSRSCLESAPNRLKELADYIVQQGLCPQAIIDHVMNEIELTTDLVSAIGEADLVSESVYENLQLKREVHAQLDKLCPGRTILTTNTSTLLVSDIEDVVSDSRGAIFAALHSHMGSPLIDIVGGPRTTKDTIDVLHRYVLSLNGEPLVLKKESPGYVLNAMLGSVLATAMLMHHGGMATKENVDRAWINQMDVAIGPFGLMDLFGLNVIFDSWQHPKPTSEYSTNKPKIMALMMPYIERGELGVKSGKGFYDYPNPAYELPGFGVADGGNLERNFALLSSALINGAVLLAANGVATPDAIERAWKVSMGTEHGPFEILQRLGGEAYLARLDVQIKEGWFGYELWVNVEAYINEFIV